MELVDGLNLAEFMEQSLEFIQQNQQKDEFEYDSNEEEIFTDLYPTEKRGLPESEVQKIIKEVVKGLMDLKKWGISHGDLKPENVMIRAQK